MFDELISEIRIKNNKEIFRDKFKEKYEGVPDKKVGFIAHYGQLLITEPILNYLLENKDLKVVHLIRKNTLEQVVSWRLLKESKRVGTVQCSKKYRIKKVYIVEKECLSYFKKIKKERKECTDLFINHDSIEVYYNDLKSNLEYELDRIMSFLGIKKEALISNLGYIKQNTNKFSYCIENFDELKEAFTGTEWEWFFNE